MGLTPASIPLMRKELLEWWAINGRHQLPWKVVGRKDKGNFPLEDLDPYPILIAEVMLQQTQLVVMLPFWERWMEAFPTLKALAQSSLNEVLLKWQGLGYYSRAKRLHYVARKLDVPPWPRTLEEWCSLPGIGRTTAGSILSTAFNLPFAILDGNVRRVLARIQAFPKPFSKSRDLFWGWSESLLDQHHPRNFNQAIMDLGALICTPQNPNCQLCPWRNHCGAYSLSNPHLFPMKEPQSKCVPEVIGIGIVLNQFSEVLIDQRLEQGLLGGLWEFPGGKQKQGESIEATISRELSEELGIEVSVEERLIILDHSYSHKKLRFVVHLCKWISGEPQPLASQRFLWVDPLALGEYAFPAANTRMIKALIEHLYQDKSCN